METKMMKYRGCIETENTNEADEKNKIEASEIILAHLKTQH